MSIVPKNSDVRNDATLDVAPIQLTTFASLGTTAGVRRALTWRGLEAMLRSAPERATKLSCPLLRAVTSTNDSRAAGSQLLELYAIVAEHDGESVTVDEAVRRLQEAGLCALVYTSPSHGVVNPQHSHGGPRWRVVAPLSRPADPQQHDQLVSCLNGALGGALARESWEPARCYFYGRVKGVAYEVRSVDGAPLDLLAEACLEPLPFQAAADANDVVAKARAVRVPADEGRAFERAAALNDVPTHVIAELRCALGVLSSDDRSTWVDVGLALASLKGSVHEDAARELWIDWSMRSHAFKTGDELRWDTFRPNAITYKTVFHLADLADSCWRELAFLAAAVECFEVLPANDDPATFEAERRRHQQAENARIGEGATSVPRAEVLTLEAALSRFVFLADGSRVADVFAPHHDLALADWATTYAASKHQVPQQPREVRGGVEPQPDKAVPVTTLWKASKERKTVICRTFKAGGALVLNDPDGRLALNSWKPFDRSLEVTDDDRRNVALFVDHVTMLFGEDAPRFLDWLAHAEQCPGVLPHTAWLHVATSVGLGRNWVASVLTRVWAGSVAANVNLPDLLASGFNGMLSRKVLAFVDEIREGARDSQWAHSETLKSVITAETRLINPKYGRQTREFNACRWLMFSNFESALPLEAGDRRVEVVKTNAKPQGPAYYQRLYAALEDAGFIAAVAEFLAQRDLSNFNPGAVARLTAAKLAVVQASTTPAAEVCQRLLKYWPADLILSGQLHSVVAGHDATGVPSAMHRRTLEQFGVKALGRPVKVGGATVRVSVLRDHDRWSGASGRDIEAELRKVNAAAEALGSDGLITTGDLLDALQMAAE